MIDNYDSFTYNVYQVRNYNTILTNTTQKQQQQQQYLCELGANVRVIRNDKITVKECAELNPSRIVISPGPGDPSSAGISMDVIKYFAGKIPILGICLGHQSIFQVFGGEVTHARNAKGIHEIVHGKTSPIEHDGKGVFENIPNQCKVIRYHSLAGATQTLPKELIVTAKTASGIIMGIRHRDMCIEGVQFHPESILTEHGKTMLTNFLNMKGGRWGL